MKTTTTPEQIAAIKAALQKLHINPFHQESGDPKYNAQRNLRGKTHYVDDDTLRWHKSRICSSGHICGGLLFRVTCSDALDMHNTKRGFRTVVFDLFGTTIFRPKLEDAFSTSKAALNNADKQEINLLCHYLAAIQSELRRKRGEAQEYADALAMIEPKSDQEAA